MSDEEIERYFCVRKQQSLKGYDVVNELVEQEYPPCERYKGKREENACYNLSSVYLQFRGLSTYDLPLVKYL